MRIRAKVDTLSTTQCTIRVYLAHPVWLFCIQGRSFDVRIRLRWRRVLEGFSKAMLQNILATYAPDLRCVGVIFAGVALNAPLLRVVLPRRNSLRKKLCPSNSHSISN